MVFQSWIASYIRYFPKHVDFDGYCLLMQLHVFDLKLETCEITSTSRQKKLSSHLYARKPSLVTFSKAIQPALDVSSSAKSEKKCTLCALQVDNGKKAIAEITNDLNRIKWTYNLSVNYMHPIFIAWYHVTMCNLNLSAHNIDMLNSKWMVETCLRICKNIAIYMCVVYTDN